jgi:hypothetical protein
MRRIWRRAKGRTTKASELLLDAPLCLKIALTVYMAINGSATIDPVLAREITVRWYQDSIVRSASAQTH